MRTCTILVGDALTRIKQIRTESIHCIVTSVPYYGLRTYGTEPQIWGSDPDCLHLFGPQGRKGGGSHAHTAGSQQTGRGQMEQHESISKASTGAFCQRCGAWRGELGLEPTIELYIEHIVTIFAELKRVLRKDGTLWLNLGDSYFGDSPTRTKSSEAFSETWDKNQTASRGGLRRSAARQSGLKPKDLTMMPARVALALQADGWWIRSDIIWNKNAPMPESVTDRPTVSYEHVFLLTKSSRYFFDAFAVRETSVSDHPSGNSFVGRQGGSRQLPMTGGAGGGEWNNVGGSRNLRSVWTIPAEPHSDCLCNACGRYYENPRGLKREVVDVDAPARGPRDAGREEIGLKDSTKFGRGAGWREKPPDSWRGSRFDDGKNLVIHPNVGQRDYESPRFGKPICECGASDRTQHFAAYPTALVDRCLRAGTSEHGVCPQCGAPWKRILKPKVISIGLRGTKRGEAVSADYSTVGWEQTCKCEPAEPIPATVLDPFAGMGTTGIAALRLNLSVVEIELQPQYARMAQIRTERDAPLLNQVIISQPNEPIPSTAMALA